jgi:hypothetical protein
LLSITENPENYIPVAPLQKRILKKLKMINKIKQILKLNDIAKYYKKKTSQGRSMEEKNHESGFNFPTMNKKERFDARLIYYLGKYITF